MTAKIIYDMSNKDYHQQLPWKEHHYSSSQWKQMLEDPEIFYRLYITQEQKKEESKVDWDIGTWYHTGVLEPHLLESTCIVWKGGRRSGKLWETFSQKHQDKIILTIPEKIQADRCIQGTLKSEIAMGYIDGPNTFVEVSFFTTFMGVCCKVRTDVICLCPVGEPGESYILDLKSTRGNVRDKHKIRKKIEDSGYDISAAYYVDVVNSIIAKMRRFKPIEKFYWVFASKDTGIAQTYVASPKNLAVGRAKYQQAMKTFLHYAEVDWANILQEEIITVEPMPWDVQEWLNINDGEEYL